MNNSLIEFWSEFSGKAAPFVHPRDLEVLQSRPDWSQQQESLDFNSYIKSQRFANRQDRSLHFSLYPCPYVGNLEAAKVVVLLLNPGFSASDYWAEYTDQPFRTRLEQNLRQPLDRVDFPFWPLDPTFCWHGGFFWWEKKLGNVVEEISNRRPGKSYFEALKYVSSNLACVELIPYHSESFGDHALLKTLRSAQAAISYGKSSLLPLAKSGKITLIVTRQAKGWELDNQQETDDLIIYRNGETRGASLGLNTRGGRAILRRLTMW